MRDDIDKLGLPSSARRYARLTSKDKAGLGPGKVDLYVKAQGDLTNQGTNGMPRSRGSRSLGKAVKGAKGGFPDIAGTGDVPHAFNENEADAWQRDMFYEYHGRQPESDEELSFWLNKLGVEYEDEVDALRSVEPYHFRSWVEDKLILARAMGESAERVVSGLLEANDYTRRIDQIRDETETGEYARLKKEMLRSFERGEPIKWSVVPRDKILRAWKIYGKYGRTLDEDILDIWDLVIENAKKVIVISQTPELMAWSGSRWTEYYDLLHKYVSKAEKAQTSEERLLAADVIVNYMHIRGSSADWFVEGGIKTLNEIRDYSPKGISLRGEFTESVERIVSVLLNESSFYDSYGFRGWVSPDGKKIPLDHDEPHGREQTRAILSEYYPAWDWESNPNFIQNEAVYSGYALQFRGWIRVIGNGMYSTWQLTGQTSRVLSQLVEEVSENDPDQTIKIDFWLGGPIYGTAEQVLDKLA